LRLRAEIVQTLYGDPYGPADVIALVNESLRADETVVTGSLWTLADNVPVADLPAILDGIDPPSSNGAGFDRRSWEAGSFYARILVRAWRGPGAFDPARTIGWLRKRAAFKGGHSESRVRAGIRNTPDRLRALAKHFFGTVAIDGHHWLAYRQFREVIILHELNADTLADLVVEEMNEAEPGSERRL